MQSYQIMIIDFGPYYTCNMFKTNNTVDRNSLIYGHIIGHILSGII